MWRTLCRLAATAVPSKAASLHPHDLRHAFVTLSLDVGASLRDVQDAAGHADPRTTRRYDRARYNFDRHPTYALAGIITWAAVGDFPRNGDDLGRNGSFGPGSAGASKLILRGVASRDAPAWLGRPVRIAAPGTARRLLTNRGESCRDTTEPFPAPLSRPYHCARWRHPAWTPSQRGGRDELRDCLAIDHSFGSSARTLRWAFESSAWLRRSDA